MHRTIGATAVAMAMGTCLAMPTATLAQPAPGIGSVTEAMAPSVDVVNRYRPLPLVDDMQTQVVSGQFVRSLRRYNQYTTACDEIPGHRSCVVSYAGRNDNGAVIMWEYVRTATGPAMLVTLPTSIDRAYGLRATYAANAEAKPEAKALATTPLTTLSMPGMTTETAQMIACGINCIYGIPVAEGGPLSATISSGGLVRFDFAINAGSITEGEIVLTDTRDLAAALRDIAAMPDPAAVRDTRWFLQRDGRTDGTPAGQTGR